MLRRWIPALTTMVAICALAVGCGSDDGAGEAPATTVPADSVAGVVLNPFLASGGTEEQAALALAAGCTLIEPENPYDSYSFNQEFTGLLSGWGADFSGNGVRRDEDAVTDALFDACQIHRGDPAAFLDAVADRLELPAADLKRAIAEACSRYGTRKDNGLEDPSAPGAFDVVPPSVTAILGDSLTPESLVAAYCSAG